ncbi:MAG: hypothetical protein A2031_09385 [Deltaproteobacteria bacterium RBG_19FT_COMBO_43_11]|nr:MAG: hypothetical protein A2031_09385 [Deltaproteobacteria bacterium RBG_19FT_COMBO_43_11]
MNKKIILGIVLSIILVYLSVRGINIHDTIRTLKKIQPSYVAIFVGIVFLMQALRSYRWGIILRPLQKIDQLSLFAVTSVGFLFIAAIPARLGELARPYLIAKKSTINISSAFGTIIIERALDSITILAITVFVLMYMDLPSWMIKSSILFFFLTLIILFFIACLSWRQATALKIINWILSKLPKIFAGKLDELIQHFIDGFRVITNIRTLFYLLFLSALIWIVDVMAIYVLLLSFGFNLPVIASVVLMIILIAGIAIPTAPGYIGNWHFACILGLSFFGVAKPEAFSFAVVYHFLSIAIIIFLGILFLPFNRFSFSDIKTHLDSTKTKEEKID